jgi:uncharacterized membrane protein
MARGIAVGLMIIYHFLFDIFYFKSYIDFDWLSTTVALIFIFISGICLSISYSRGGKFSKFAKRGIKLLFFGMLVTAVSFIFLKEGFILFGILHFFGVSSFLLYPFLKYLKNNLSFLFLGIIIVFIGVFLHNNRYESGSFLWLGLIPKDFYSFDHFPLIPWFGFMLIGVFAGKVLYPDGKRRFKVPAFKNRAANIFTFLGRNSLTIYFLHQPIILFILFLLGHGEFLSVFY